MCPAPMACVTAVRRCAGITPSQQVLHHLELTWRPPFFRRQDSCTAARSAILSRRRADQVDGDRDSGPRDRDTVESPAAARSRRPAQTS
jgi:hypothetical protein